MDNQGTMFKNILEGKEELTDDKMQEMMQEWMQNGQEMEQMNQMMGEWGKVWEDDFELKMSKDPNQIQFH